jgi:predicted DNA-binding transcriptional regulator AlpA
MKMLEAKDIKEILGMALANVYKLMKQPDFPAIRISERRYIVPEEKFYKWIDEQIEEKRNRKGSVCTVCGKQIETPYPNKKYCADCGKLIRAQQNRDRVRKYREKKRET